VRSLEDISEVSQYAMASALASGDDRAIRVAELEADLGRLNNLWGDHQKGTSGARNNLFYAKNTADSMVKKLAAAESAVAVVSDTKITADSFTLTLKGKPVPGNSRTEIALAYSGKLRQSIPGAARLAVMNGFEEEIGRVQGDYPLIVSARPGAGDKVYVSMDIKIADLRMSVFEDTAFNDLPSSDTGALGLSTRLINAVNSVSELPARYTRELAKAREQVEQAERRAAAPFPQERELFEKQAELAQLQRDMAQETAPTAAIADAEAAEAVPALSRPEPARARDSTRFVVGPIDLERRVARIMKNWRGDIPTVRVVESAGKLPKEARREDGWEQAEGWYDGRSTIYLVANNLANLSRADQVLAHEAFGHYGVEGVVGKDQWAGIIADVAKLRAKPEAMRADMRAALASAERRYGSQNDAVFAREFLAVMAERGVASSLLGRVLAAARRWARALGFKIDAWGSAEVREIVARGLRQVRDSGGPRPGSGRGAALSVPEGGAFPLKDSKPESFMGSLSERFKEPGDSLLDRLKGKLEDWKPATLGLLTLRQLAEIAGRYLPSGDAYVDLTTRMATRRNVLTNEGADIAQKWEKMQRADRRSSTAAQKAARTTASDRTVDLMHDATLAGTDPAEAYKIGVLRLQHNGEAVSLDEPTATAAINAIESKLADKTWAKTAPDAIQNTMRGDIARIRAGIKTEQGRAAAYPDLVKRYAALPEAWQGLYRDVRDAYLRRSEQTMDAMLGRIEGMEIADREKKALRERVRAHFESARIEGPYFPLARFGEFWASVEKDGADGEKERQFIMAETQRDRDRMVKQAEVEGWALAKKGRKIENVRAQDGASGAFVADVINTLGVAGVGEKVQDEVYQLYLRTLPDLSTRKQFIHRKKVAGYDADALRAFAGQMNHGAHQLARLEYGQQLSDALIAIEKEAKTLQDTADGNADRASAAAGEFKKRHEWVMNPTGADWVQKVSAFNFVFYLGVSPAAAAVNLTQTAIISYPALAARYGAGKAMSAINEAMLASIRTKGGNLEKALKTDDERRAYRQLVDMGAIDVTQAHDLAGLGDNPTQDYNAKLHRAMNAVSFLFHKAEVFNREATGLAAYRLARGAGESHDAALKRASDTIWQTHYDYSNANRARFMQSNAAKILFAFKQYSQNTTYYLWRAFYESMKDESPEVRRIARQRLAGTLGMTAVFSGALGLPLVGMMFGIANAMAALFGDDDEPWDAETEFRNFLADMLPPALARIVTGGLVEGGLEAAGLPAPEIGSRTSLNDLWFRAPNQEMEGRDLWHYILEQIAGPVGGIFGGAMSGAALIGDGLATGNDAHVWRGFESMMPKVARDTMKAIRYEAQGVNTLRGDPLIEDAGVSAGIFQLLGFSPAQVQEQYTLNSAVKSYEEGIMSRRGVLLDAYALTSTERDVEGIRATVAKIREFNRAHPGAAISTQTLRQSLKSRQKFSDRAMNGIAVSPKLRGELSERLRFVFEDDESEAE
jgi:Large polyvalent protein associated domain 39